MAIDCTDRFHADPDAPRESYVLTGPDGLSVEGYRCPTCGFQTVMLETYTPAEKPCGECGKIFEGMPDVPGEYCDACFTQKLAEWDPTVDA